MPSQIRGHPLHTVSFVVTGVAWRWIFNPESGINLFFNIFGINALFTSFGFAPLKPGWITDVPAIFVFEQTFKATRYNLGAAASTVMLVLVGLVIVPYLMSTLREED